MISFLIGLFHAVPRLPISCLSSLINGTFDRLALQLKKSHLLHSHFTTDYFVTFNVGLSMLPTITKIYWLNALFYLYQMSSLLVGYGGYIGPRGQTSKYYKAHA